MDDKQPVKQEHHGVEPAADAGNGQGVEQPVADTAAEQGELLALREEVAALRDRNLRLLAEQRNQQQRLQRDKAEALRYAEADFARDLLPILDGLERTLESAAGTPEAAAVADGVRIVYEQFLQILRNRNIERIEALGQRFDPELHEAMAQQPSDEHPSGVVIREVARGYRMHDRVLRASRVIVSSGPASSDADQENQQTREQRDANL